MPDRMPPDLEPEEADLWQRIAVAVRGATAACPDPYRLRAFLTDALPDDQAPAVESHLRHCRVCQALREDLAALELQPLAEGEAWRIHDRVFAAIKPAAARPAWRPLWRPILLVAAGLIFAMAVSVIVWRLEATRLSPAVAALPAAPASLTVFHLDKPPVSLPAALIWRGTQVSSWQVQIKPALDAYRDGRYADAASRLAPVVSRFPRQPEPLFYLGVCQLFLGQNNAAAASLGRASVLATGSLRQNADWYRALAWVRAGQSQAALPLLKGLCASAGLYATRACQGVQALVTGPKPPMH